MKVFIKNFLEKDVALSQKMRRMGENKMLHPLAVFLAHSGDSWYWLAFLFLVWLFSKSIWHTYSAFLAASIIIQAVLVLSIKFIIKRSRPAGEWGAIYRNSDPHSFPSGHATRAAMLAVLFWGLHLTPLAIILTIWVFGVSFARVALGVHYLSDVFAGWILGICLGFFLIWLQPFLYQILPWVFFR
ncbi:MAG: phosphatase PAP2 family protein [Anaerolineaceae bacterium]|jgi:undecaprenyl-diphosphatase|nr:MAG: phosphatase PAP2 family protein [Anaerolineaceae bacterium]